MAEKKSWLKIINKLKKFLSEVGPIWEGSTLSGYQEKGPYYCGMCEYAKGMKQGEVFKDADGKGRCLQSVVIADPKVKKDDKGLPIINLQIGCCEFVEKYEKKGD